MRFCAPHREVVEGASELTHPGHPQNIGADTLGVPSNDWIRSFDEAYVPSFILFPCNRFHEVTGPSASYQWNIGNERLPDFDPVGSEGLLVTTPSVRQESTEELIKKALKEDDDGDSTVERLADRITRASKPQGRPRALKRSEPARW